MGWPFKAKSFLEPEDEAWHLDTWAWLLTHWGGLADLKLSPLITPTREFFPPSEAKGHARAEVAFEQVKTLAKMESWACRLEPQPERAPLQVSRHVILKPERNAPLGTFGYEGQEVMITYDPGLIDDPASLVATLAHELSHYRIHSIPGEPPGGEEMDEFATDLAVAYLGFGLFGAETAFRFRASNEGWGYSSQGYFRQEDWVFALATFLALRDEAPDAARKFMKPELAAALPKAMKRLQSAYSDRIGAMRAIVPSPKAESA
ncbi:MAG: hypothetical protein JSR45_13555 [Proteobacteria bacterium]|nr:hypothetical protein [Pseudomonadota bacterium]